MEDMIKVSLFGKEQEIKVRKLKWGDYKKIRLKSIVLREHNGEPSQFRDIDLYNDLKLLCCMVESPIKTMLDLEQLSLEERTELVKSINNYHDGKIEE